MALPVDVRDLAARILARLDEARDFYLHTRQAWRVVQQIAHENRSVGIVDTATGHEVLAHDLEPMAQRYVTVHLAESAFKGLSGLLEDWILGLARLWLAAYPKLCLRSSLHVISLRSSPMWSNGSSTRRPDQLEPQDTDQGSSDVESRWNDPSHRGTDKWA